MPPVLTRRKPVGRKAATLPPPGSPGDRLRDLIDRKAKGRSHGEIADAAGVPRPNLSNILTGKVPSPGVLTVQAILDAIGATWCDYHKAGQKNI